MAVLKAVVVAGPDPGVDQIGRWRSIDLCRDVAERWEVSDSETGMLRWRWSLELSHRKTRPRHLQSDEEAPARLSALAPAYPQARRFAIRSQSLPRRRPGTRPGRAQGRTGDVWWQRGHTPRGRRDLGYPSAWIIGAVCRCATPASRGGSPGSTPRR